MISILPFFAAVVLPTSIDDSKLVGTFRHDPVLLVEKGQKEVGATSIFVDRYGYRYLFTTWPNRSAFLKDPAKFEIQNGGGCGNMGSLSGRGSPDLFWVHQGKIFLFASYGCRERFKSMPEKLIERDDDRPSGTQEEALRGRELIRKAVEWSGGADAIRKLRVLQFEWREKVKQGNTDYLHTQLLALEWPGRVIQKSKWNEYEWSDVTDGKTGTSIGSSGTKVLHPQQIRELHRLRNRTLPALLWATQKPDFIAFSKGKSASSRERVEVWFDGTWAALEIEPSDGRIGAMEFVAYRSLRGVERHVFSDFATVGEVKLPSAWTASFDGKEYGKRTQGEVRYRLDQEGLSFVVPK